MPFVLDHVLVSQPLEFERHDSPEGFFFTVAAQGSFRVMHPGRLQREASASVRRVFPTETVNPQPTPPPRGIDDPTGGGLPSFPDPVTNPLKPVDVSEEPIPLDLRILDPDGRLFTADEVTLADLKKYRSARGEPRFWSFVLSGKSSTYLAIPAVEDTISDPTGSLLQVNETIASASAAPLVPRTPLPATPLRLAFDLNRVGDFVASVSRTNILSPLPWRGAMRLLDPNGDEFARSGQSHLRCPIPLSALGRSHDAAGNPRPWTLEVTPAMPGTPGHFNVTATILGQGRLETETLQSRIQQIFGPSGTFLEIQGRNAGDNAQAVLTIHDIAAAETIDMHGLLDARLKARGRSTDVRAEDPIVLFSRDSDLGHGARVDVGRLKTTSITISIGPAQHLNPGTPAIGISVGIEGTVKVTWNGLTLATASPIGGRAQIEIGLKPDPDGTPGVVTWVSKLFDIDFSTAAIAAFVVAAGPIAGGISAAIVEDAVEDYVNNGFASGVKDLFDDPTLAPRILMTLLGAHMTYLPVRFDGTAILFEHIAPLEPDPRPRPDYAGAIGRALLETQDMPLFMPRTLGDTWAADNLKAKIEHIVVVMMENRSYDHVLGHRALAPGDPRDAADGWTPDLVAAVNARAEAFRPAAPDQPGVYHDTGPAVRLLRDSAFQPNALGLFTRLPVGVGHEFADVAEQLAGRINHDGKRINDPGGFIDNFRRRMLGNNPFGKNLSPDDPDKRDVVVPCDVLRYYDAADLPMYGFLAENFAYCDRYFCSHPGPTLPNRMYSITGDVQHDRYGFPILDSNDGDNFLLSRAQTVFDVLTRHGVDWRVYESDPSVAMLRMFARYASDDVRIRPRSELERDAADGNLPQVVVVEPAMHHHPENDDHPDADMYRGQQFVRDVYAALTANPALWRKTLLIVTYDEHGGFYDHVVPPIADVVGASRPLPTAGNGTTGSGTSQPPPGQGGTVAGGHGRETRAPASEWEVAVDPGNPAPAPASRIEKVGYGVRVHTFVVSPWAALGKGPSVVLDHCSILKTILARFCADTRPFLSDRVRVSHSFESFLGESQPRETAAPPRLDANLPADARRIAPGASRIVTPPLFRKRMREEKVDYHDISGRLARMLGR